MLLCYAVVPQARSDAVAYAVLIVPTWSDATQNGIARPLALPFGLGPIASDGRPLRRPRQLARLLQNTRDAERRADRIRWLLRGEEAASKRRRSCCSDSGRPTKLQLGPHIQHSCVRCP